MTDIDFEDEDAEIIRIYSKPKGSTVRERLVAWGIVPSEEDEAVRFLFGLFIVCVVLTIVIIILFLLPRQAAPVPL